MNMREWSLQSGDPLNLILAADSRLSSPSYVNDHIWEMELGSGEPSALALYTTFGLRARSLRIFPRFTEARTTIANISDFDKPPTIRRCYPNFIEISFSPFKDLETIYEVHVPHSNIITGRLTVSNRSIETRKFQLEICTALVPLEGYAFSHTQMQMVNILAGETSGLVPILFLTGGPHPGSGPQPSLVLDLELSSNNYRQLAWAMATSDEHQASFDEARLIAAQNWDAERSRIEMVNAQNAIEISTSDSDWDAALAFSQNAAFNLFFPANDNLPYPSFVHTRGPDQGYSRKGDGTDHPATWEGQSLLEAYYISSVIPAAPYLLQGLLYNFLSTQSNDGKVDGKPGLGGQRGNYLAMPLLISLAWNLYKTTEDNEFLKSVFPKLYNFFWNWFSPINDRDNDGIPEWTYVLQTGYEENPLFDTWNPWSLGADISCATSPALLAMLYREAQILIQIAARTENQSKVEVVKQQAERLKSGLDQAWNPRTALYNYKDCKTGQSTSGKVLARQNGSGIIKIKQTFSPPIRLLIEVQANNLGTKRPHVSISEYASKGENEVITGEQFQWHSGGMVATSQQVHERIGRIKIKGLKRNDKVVVRQMDFTHQDHTLLLPLWAGIPDEQQAQVMIGQTILNADRFDRPYGIPACPLFPEKEADSSCMSVYLPWNSFICEGLLSYGYRKEAARLIVHIMLGIIQNLKQKRAFYQRYHAESGKGVGERNAISGLAPVGLFLKVLGVQVLSATRVRLEGINPFPWPVTIHFKGLKIIRGFENTEVRFPNGKQINISDPAPCIISL